MFPDKWHNILKKAGIRVYIWSFFFIYLVLILLALKVSSFSQNLATIMTHVPVQWWIASGLIKNPLLLGKMEYIFIEGEGVK